MTAYQFRQGIDYGARKGTLGLAFHMAEGGDGTLGYLAKRPTETTAQWKARVRGVSANAVILTDGTVWNMVPWDHASGSMNPNDRNPSTTGYYNGTVIKAVLGDKYVDPNAYSISVEICGFRAAGPSDAQVRGAIAWGLDMRTRFPTLKGAYGHHDQTDTKGCPGLTANMKAIFAGVGGHGLFTHSGTEETVQSFPIPAVPTLITIPVGTKLFDNSALQENAATVTVTPAREMPLLGSPSNPAAHIVEYVNEAGVRSGKAYWKQDVSGESSRPAPQPVTDCTAEVKAGIVAATPGIIAADRKLAKVVWA